MEKFVCTYSRRLITSLKNSFARHVGAEFNFDATRACSLQQQQQWRALFSSGAFKLRVIWFSVEVCTVQRARTHFSLLLCRYYNEIGVCVAIEFSAQSTQYDQRCFLSPDRSSFSCSSCRFSSDDSDFQD